MDGIDSAIDDLYYALDDIWDAIDDLYYVLDDIFDAIDGLTDYSEILAAIKTAIENIETGGGAEPYMTMTLKNVSDIGKSLYLSVHEEDSPVVEGGTLMGKWPHGAIGSEVTYRYEITQKTITIKGRVTTADLQSAGVHLIDLDVNNYPELLRLRCVGYNLDVLNVSRNTKLTELQCSYNQLTNLNLSKNTELSHLNCEKNQLTDLDLSYNTKLRKLTCGGNYLTTLDLSDCPDVYDVACSFNQLTEIKLPSRTEGNGTLYYKKTSDGDTQKLSVEQVAELTSKGWKVMQYDGSKWVDYPGE